ncbi:hypothetical protein PPERSA_01186 [Pseudocohnilembus persalinus]|uniref:Cytosol aminopeptidase domain-containing protein n=1 Tax=Pseudocohnilembus persalinus TaxID=266149 RepID=A0A0V0R1V9_PSEPJ|nr:hypothetical protein PPERSA_01186 [Pseudocohnilembus persalinus]|eukprot:KRX08256.1 hypothetical protein PPERSA_01186 [Pseudocohnilembus persalinus]
MTQTFELYDQFYEYFSVTLISNNATYLNGQQNFIIGGNIGLYSPLVQIQQSDGVSATGLGCMKNRGFGCGFSGVSSWFCGGSGGSHGGQGSIGQETSVSPNLICQQIQSRGIYGTADYPVFEGSGGGGLQDDSQGSGGGFIFIQAYHKLIVDGFIEADGTPPKIQSAYSNGSGSGGSIQIYAQYLTRLSNIKFENDGQNYNLESYKLQTKQKKWYGHREDQSVQMGDINDFKKLYKMQKYNKYIQSHTLADQIKLGCITANGGIGVIGGGGGGGRIRIFLTYSMEEVMLQGFSSDFKQVIIKTDPGYSPILDQYQTNLGQGSIVSTPCPPGYYAEDGIYFCKLCKPGTYKSQISVGPCQPCNDIPENMVAVQTISLDYNCQLVCKDNKAWEYYLPNSNGYFVCLTQWEYFYINIYGSNGLMIIIIMIVICLIMLFRKVVKERRSMIRQQKEQLLEKHIKQNQEIDNMINQDNQQNAIEEFIVDDLPYHNKRIYLQGENSYSLPWYLQGQTELDENINPSVYIDLCKQFNEIASYNLIKKVLLICLKYGYLPFYYMISVHYKKQKFQKLKELIDQRQSELIINQQVKIKLSSSPDYTLSYLDIMDYNKDILLWNYQMKYPITLVLSGNGTFLFPLRFNTKDPLSKSLLITLSYCKQEEQFEEENNRGSYKKKLGKFIRKFNDIAKQIDYLQSEKTFIKQFINLLELIEEANQQLFRNLDIQAQMCVHKNLKKNHNFYEKNQDKQQDYYNDDYNESEYKQSDYYYQEKDQTINQYLDEDQEQSYYDFQKQESLNQKLVNQIVTNISLQQSTDLKYKSVVKIVDEDQLASQNLLEQQQQHLKTAKLDWAYSEKNSTLYVLQKNDKNEQKNLKSIRNLASKCVDQLFARKIQDLDIEFPQNLPNNLRTEFLNALQLSNYKYKVEGTKKQEIESEQENDNSFKPIQNINVLNQDFNAQDELAKFRLISAQSALYARELGNHRANYGNTEYFEDLCHNLIAEYPGLEINKVKGEQLLEQGMNLHYCVGKGSKNPPMAINLTYKGNPSSEEFIALVGKGLTFDAGGLNIKPTGFMETMYIDKQGACNVLGILKGVLDSKLKVNLTCTIGLAENFISSTSYRPSDIIKAKNGITVEIGNTDAEGRLVLADSICWTNSLGKKITHMFEFSTLTGACAIALGNKTAGIFTNTDELAQELIQSGKQVSEQMWQLPIFDDHREAMKGTFSDLNNSGKTRFGGASQAAAFLENFFDKDQKWAHIDIAGPCDTASKSGYYSPGSTAFGVETLLNYLRQQSQK